VKEIEIRSAIADRSLGESPDQPMLVVPELALCQAEVRIDLAVIETQRLVGWEIKARTDNLNRLPKQQEIYSKVFDRMWLAADNRHLEKAMDVIPTWWGVVRVENRDGQCHLTQVRGSRLNRNVDLRALVCLLWRDEVIVELQRVGLDEGAARLPKRELWEALAGAAPRHVSPTRLRARVRAQLMARQDWRVG
jgi:hypothetical protein